MMPAMIDYTLPLDQLPDPLPIEPLERPFDVSITPPGSKSITCRAYVLAALAQGTSKIIRPLRAEDTDTLLDALCTLGAEAKWVPGTDGEDVFITGVAGRFPRGGELHMGDGGAPTRFMIACACLAAKPVTIDGSQRMRERPIAEGVEMLRALGAQIEYVEEEGRLPVRVSPSAEFKGGTLTVGKTASSQFISAVELIAPWLHTGIRIDWSVEPTSYMYLGVTAVCLLSFGVKSRGCLFEEPYWSVVPEHPYSGVEFRVEPDASSAAYWQVAASLVPQATCTLLWFSERFAQPDEQITECLVRSGTSISWLRRPRSIRMTGPPMLDAIEWEADTMPDGAVALCVTAACATGVSTITGLHTLRHKESDRLAALEAELTRVGCEVETGEDWIRITPMRSGTPVLRTGWSSSGSEIRGTKTSGSEIRGTKTSGSEIRGTKTSGSEIRGTSNPVIIETYNDHRMAMAFAVLGLARPGISIRNPACVAKSYPTFWKDFAKLYESARKA